jgi:outer membrane cobalamin receptor
VEDYIEKDEATQIFANNDKYRFRGFELAAETRFLKNLMLRAGYTYLYSRDRSSATEKKELQYRPRNKYTFEALYTAPFGLTAYVSISHTEKEYYYSKKSPYIKARLNDYALLNMKVSQTVYKDNVSLYCGVNNILDADYEQSYALPQAGRYVYGGVELRF